MNKSRKNKDEILFELYFCLDYVNVRLHTAANTDANVPTLIRRTPAKTYERTNTMYVIAPGQKSITDQVLLTVVPADQ